MLDSDLASLYGVTTGRLNEQVKRNDRRFPSDFAFQLTADEFDALISQNAISKTGRGGRRKLPWVFTEQGVAMLSSVLHSDRAADVNVAIMRTFVKKLRQMLATHTDLAERIEKIEATQDRHTSVIELLAEEIDRINELPPEPEKRRIGFHIDE